MSKYFFDQDEASEKPLNDSRSHDSKFRTFTCQSTDLDVHVADINCAIVELQNKIEQLKYFQLNSVEAKQEICLLINNIQDADYIRMLRDMLGVTVDSNDSQVGMVETCHDDEFGGDAHDDEKKLHKTIPYLWHSSAEDEKVMEARPAIRPIQPSPEVTPENVVIPRENDHLIDFETEAIDPKEMDEMCLKSLEDGKTEQTSITAGNDKIQSSYNSSNSFCPVIDAQPYDHPHLLDDDIKKVMKIWNLGKSQWKHRQHPYKFNPDIYSSLEIKEFVVSEIINGYNGLIVKRSENSGLPSVCAAPDYFLDAYNACGVHGIRNLEINIDADLLLFPMHRDGYPGHWYACAVDMRPHDIYGSNYRHVRSFDSLYDADPYYEAQILKELSQVTKFLTYQMKRQDQAQVEWRYTLVKSAPRQLNYVDCGVFTCKNFDYLSTDETPNFDQSHIPYHRCNIVQELEEGKLSRHIGNHINTIQHSEIA